MTDEEKQPTLAQATRERRTLTSSSGKQVTFRLLEGWPGAKVNELVIFEDTPEDEKTASFKGKQMGNAWGGYYQTTQKAWEFLKSRGYK